MEAAHLTHWATILDAAVSWRTRDLEARPSNNFPFCFEPTP